MDKFQLYVIIGLVAFAVVRDVVSQTDEGCKFSSLTPRKRCPYRVRRGDESECVDAGCCFDASAKYGLFCFRKERSLSFGFGVTIEPPGLQNQNSGYLNFGGEPGYPGSSLIKRCSDSPCLGFPNMQSDTCVRLGCCYDFQRRGCFYNSFNFIRLRPNCRPGFEDAPSCRDINECDPNPCVNGGTCVNLINDFLCCIDEPEGQTCDQVCPFPTLTSTDGGLTPTSGGPYGLGDTITFLCAEAGYTLTGFDTITCMNNGAFDNSAPVCLNTQCLFPTLTSTNGGLTPTSGGPYGVDETILFSCTDPAFALTGSDTLTCMNNGAFDNSAPVCLSTPCSSPPAPINVLTDPVQTTYNPLDEVTYSCADGSPIPAGEPTSNRCLPTGLWESASGPDCPTTQCAVPGDIAGGTFTPSGVTSIDSGATLSFACDIGFTISTGGVTSSICQAGTFVFDPLFDGTECFRNCAQDDATLNPIANLIVNPSQASTGNGYSFGTMLSYSCSDATQVFTGSATLTCQTDGSYDNPVPSCITDCGAPPTSGNTRVITSWNGQTTEGTVIEYTCDTGGVGSTTITCTSSGWDPTDPAECFPAGSGTCGNPPLLPNGEFIGTIPATPVAIITYQCLAGFTIAPGSTASTVCQTGGDYDLSESDDNFPECTSTSACTVPHIPGAVFDPEQTSFAAGESLSLTCEEGTPTGTTMATCQDGTFQFNPSFDSTECITDRDLNLIIVLDDTSALDDCSSILSAPPFSQGNTETPNFNQQFDFIKMLISSWVTIDQAANSRVAVVRHSAACTGTLSVISDFTDDTATRDTKLDAEQYTCGSGNQIALAFCLNNDRSSIPGFDSTKATVVIDLVADVGTTDTDALTTSLITNVGEVRSPPPEATDPAESIFLYLVTTIPTTSSDLATNVAFLESYAGASYRYVGSTYEGPLIVLPRIRDGLESDCVTATTC
ncbi:uncharacterized protein LOC143447152 [Clavelina lepadiformis]|uniref:uncharacterized protein LOC143447152 n=1 Tax=Clavelina lepadiformis TaxID=159417 RepID=UPI004042E975